MSQAAHFWSGRISGRVISNTEHGRPPRAISPHTAEVEFLEQARGIFSDHMSDLAQLPAKYIPSHVDPFTDEALIKRCRIQQFNSFLYRVKVLGVLLPRGLRCRNTCIWETGTVNTV